jgi:hypothetical protein
MIARRARALMPAAIPATAVVDKPGDDGDLESDIEVCVGLAEDVDEGGSYNRHSTYFRAFGCT